MSYDREMKRADAKEITLSLIQWLDQEYDEKTITTEMAVNTTYGSKVADVVISNGHTIAYEIKSEFDTTKRLAEQVRGFSEIFEYVYVVFWADKFNLETLDIPDTTGAIMAYWDNGKISFKKIKNARINRFLTPIVLAHMLWKSELQFFLDKKNIMYKKSYDKCQLVDLFVKNHSKTEAAKILRFVVKKRFRRGYLAYKKAKSRKDSLIAFIKYKKDINYIASLK